MRMLISLSIWVFIFSCSVDEKKVILPGRIAVSSDGGYVIYDNSQRKHKVKLKEDKHSWHSSLLWLHKQDLFVGVEGLKTITGATSRSNVVLFDLNGNIVESIYKSQENELVGYAYPSWKDSRLLLTSSVMGDVEANPLQGLSSKQSLMIIDIKSREVIKRVDNIGSSPGLQFEESPWLYDEHRFVYSRSAENRMVNEGVTDDSIAKVSPGIYVYDLETDQHTLIVPGGHFAIASPNSNEIAFMKENSIGVLNLNDSTEETIYKIGVKEKVPNIHWTPDGKYVYLVSFDYYGIGDLFTSREKLVEVSTGKEVPFKKVSHGFSSYTWK